MSKRKPVHPEMVNKAYKLILAALISVTLASCTSVRDRHAEPKWPTPPPPVRVCGNESILGGGPVKPPRGAVIVPTGDNSQVDFTQTGRVFWFAPGTHTFGSEEFGQIIAGDGSTYLGAPGATLDGARLNRYAITAAQGAHDVTVEYLTIQNFGREGGNSSEGVVNQGAGTDWTIRYNTVKNNAGAGLILGSGNVATYNCLTANEQYGFNAASPEGPKDIRLDHNEISYNNTYDWEAKVEGCGCTGGGKFWMVTNADVTNNYVHDNKGVGLWADTNNRGLLFKNNYLLNNEGEGIIYETSYNTVITHNIFLRNGLAKGPTNPGFPTPALYISESGGDIRVASRYRGKLEISHNLFRDNWSGVVLWENSDRYCGSTANTSSGACTLVNPKATLRSCNRDNIDKEPYRSDCRWKTQNVRVHDNTFETDPSHIGTFCTFDHSCGVSALMSNFGTYPDWSPYQGYSVEKALTFHQDNSFYDNTYRGPWRFKPLDQSTSLTFPQWRGAPYRQDKGSTMKWSQHG